MKRLIHQLTFSLLLLTSTSLFFFTSCQKELKQNDRSIELQSTNAIAHGHLTQTNAYTSEVAVKWMDMQIRLMRTASGIPNVAFTRPYVYSGIALYEAVVPGMPSY